jgi:hypothetical protein
MFCGRRSLGLANHAQGRRLADPAAKKMSRKIAQVHGNHQVAPKSL